MSEGALAGVRIIELAGIGPAPFAGMMLADHGADVIRVDRPGGQKGGVPTDLSKDILARSRRQIAVDLKSPDGIAVVRALTSSADGLIEGFRPGVMERLGLGPDQLISDNPKLVYGRMTGWGQAGPYAHTAGHDINYIALSGALHSFGRAGEKPTPPINLVGDFGGGGMLLAFGMLSGILHARASGEGQVIDCAMTDGSALLMSMIWSLRAQGLWNDQRGTNLLDTGAHFYDTYETRDGKYVSIGSIEPQFYAQLVERLKLDDSFRRQMDPACWPSLRASLAEIFHTKSQSEWCNILEGTDACFAPVLSMEDAPKHPHNVDRQTFVTANDVVQPAPGPRFSKTAAPSPRMSTGDSNAAEVLQSAGFDDRRIRELIDMAVVV